MLGVSYIATFRVIGGNNIITLDYREYYIYEGGELCN